MKPARETAVEDLSYEHGVVNRLMRIYDLLLTIDLPFDIFIDVARINTEIFKIIVEEHHEKQEELYIFPRIRDKHYVTGLIADHRQSAKLTKQIIITASGEKPTKELAGAIKDIIKQLIRLYRDHTIIEDTIAFPAFRKSISKADYDEISANMRQTEPDFKPLLQKITALENIIIIN